MKKNASIIIFLLLVTVVVAYTFLNGESYQEEKITLGVYRSYDDYGLTYTTSEDEIYPFLVKSMDESKFVDSEIVADGHKLLKCTDEETLAWLSKMIIRSDHISEIYTTVHIDSKKIVNFTFDYIDVDNNRIILTYTHSGMVSKVMKVGKKVVEINNDLIKITYEFKEKK